MRGVSGEFASLTKVRDLALHSLDPSQDTWEVLQAADGLGDNRPCINKIAVAIWDVIKIGRGREWGRG